MEAKLRSEQLEIDWAAASQTSAEPLLLTIRQAAALLAIGRSSVYNLIRDGDLRVVHVYRSCRVPYEEVRSCVARLRASCAPSAGPLTHE